MTDWGRYLACTGCHALMGEPCYDRSSGGPQALPPVYRTVPHSSRKLSPAKAGAKSTALATSTRAPRPPAVTALVTRRRNRRTETEAAAWQRLAERRRRD